jgi:hypothetical protein
LHTIRMVARSLAQSRSQSRRGIAMGSGSSDESVKYEMLAQGLRDGLCAVACAELVLSLSEVTPYRFGSQPQRSCGLADLAHVRGKSQNGELPRRDPRSPRQPARAQRRQLFQAQARSSRPGRQWRDFLD